MSFVLIYSFLSSPREAVCLSVTMTDMLKGSPKPDRSEGRGLVLQAEERD